MQSFPYRLPVKCRVFYFLKAIIFFLFSGLCLCWGNF